MTTKMTTLPIFTTLATQLDLDLSAMRPIAGPTMPRPYRDLLVHEGDMTQRLEQHYRDAIHLKPLQVIREPHQLLRKVILTTGSGHLVEFGVIRIFLDAFNDEVRPLVESCRYPLGGLLARFSIPRRSDLQGFFRIESDATLNQIMGLTHTTALYGRLNRLATDADRTLAEVVEILPP